MGVCFREWLDDKGIVWSRGRGRKVEREGGGMLLVEVYEVEFVEDF